MKLLRPILASVTLGSAFFFSTFSPVSGATNGPNSGLVNFVITPVANGTSGKILITGAIGDYGTIRTVGTKSSSLQRVILKKGSFIFDEFALQVASQDHQPAIDPSNCSFRVVSGSTGAVTLSKGTGLYKDVSGTLSSDRYFCGHRSYEEREVHR